MSAASGGTGGTLLPPSRLGRGGLRLPELTHASPLVRGASYLLALVCTLAVLWSVLLADLQAERDALRVRLDAPAAAAAPGHEAQALRSLREQIAAHEQRWMPEGAGPVWTAELQRAMRAPGLQLEQLRAVREGGDPRHPAFAVSLRLQASFAATVGWLGAVAQAPLAVAMQPLRITAAPDGGVRIETRALAFRGAPAASTIAPLPPFADAVLPPAVAALRPAAPDPFDPRRLAEALGLHRARAPSSDGPDQARAREPLESYELRDIRLLGVLQSDARRVAIVQAAGAAHRVEVGQYLGRQHGRVERIADNGVDLMEWVLSDGQWQRRGTRLLLPPGPGGDTEAAQARP